MPRMDVLLNDLATQDGILIVTGVSSFLKLEGEQELLKFIRQLLNMFITGHVIFITFQCKRFLTSTDPRLRRRIIIVDGTEKMIPPIFFTAPSIPLPRGCESIKGIDQFAEIIEAAPVETMYVTTEKSKSSFPHSLYQISDIRDAYDALVLKDESTSYLPRTLGTDKQWSYALGLIRQKSTWTDVIDDEFGSHDILEHVFASYPQFSEDKKWLYFIALKLYGAKRNWCLTSASRKADNLDDFLRQVYRCLLDKAIGDKDFWDCYESILQ